MSAAAAAHVAEEVLAIGDACERALVQGLGLVPRALPAELADREGRWKGEEARIETRSYGGTGVRWVRVARVTSGPLAIVNLLCVGEPSLALPILGVDVVALGARGGAMVAADLTPMEPDAAGREARSRELGDLVGGAAAGLPPGGELPAWCEEWFSAYALYVRPAGPEVAAAGRALARYPEAFVRLAGAQDADAGRAEAVSRRQRDYFLAHRTQDKGLGLLSRMFGAAWTARYVTEILFPTSWPTA